MVSEASNNALVLLTVPTAVQAGVAAVEYHNVPLAVLTAVIAMPLSALASTSVIKPVTVAIAETRVLLVLEPAVGAGLSSLTAVIDTDTLFNTGASLTALTTMVTVLVAVEKAVVVPLVDVSTFVPAVPEV